MTLQQYRRVIWRVISLSSPAYNKCAMRILENHFYVRNLELNETGYEFNAWTNLAPDIFHTFNSTIAYPVVRNKKKKIQWSDFRNPLHFENWMWYICDFCDVWYFTLHSLRFESITAKFWWITLECTPCDHVSFFFWILNSYSSF